MARKFKKTLIRVAAEATAGTAITTFTATDVLQVADASFDTDYKNVERNLMRPYMGHSGTLVGTRNHKIDFSVELATSGTAGTAPPWGRLMIACACAEVITAGTLVEYMPVSDALKTITIQYWADGVLHTAAGCMGSVSIELNEGDRPMLKFSSVGADAGLATAATPTSDLTAWKIPEVVNSINSAKLTLGGAYAAGIVTGGTQYCSRGLSFNVANDAKFNTLLGCSGADITDRKPTGRFELELDAAQEVAMRGEINANTPTSLSLMHGSAPGKRVLLWAPRITRLNPKYQDQDGKLLVGMDFNAEPLAGNDEFRLALL